MFGVVKKRIKVADGKMWVYTGLKMREPK